MDQRSIQISSTQDTGEVDVSINTEERKRHLTSRFLYFGLIGVMLISLVFSVAGHFRLQYNETVALSERVHKQLASIARSLSGTERVADPKLAIVVLGTTAFNRVVGAEAVQILDRKNEEVFSRGPRTQFLDSRLVPTLTIDEPYEVIVPKLFAASNWLGLLTGSFETNKIAVFIGLKGQQLTVILSVNNSENLLRQKNVVLRLFLFLLVCSSLLFSVLYVTFQKGMRTIDEQEERLNKQISSLSNLLSINKSMQRSIRTASARAVELNEQFLRRVGADLHDGPAQMIGFSIMRLNQALEKDESGLIGPEFHAIKQALEESLEEIRGISSGLVLPELEVMTLEQCMQKVVLLHTTSFSTDVAEFYQDLDRDIDLPIKICAYRFVQEGLNNAHKHGQAEKCKLTVSIIEDMLHISLKDNGIGFRKSKLNNDGTHLGLIGLKDRIESLGGRLSINSELGVGTALKLTVSLKDS